MTSPKLPASEFCDRHRGWVDEGRVRVVDGYRVCDGCRELRSPKPIGPAPRPVVYMPTPAPKRRHRKKVPE